jgi:hypothetical protein
VVGEGLLLELLGGLVGRVAPTMIRPPSAFAKQENVFRSLVG